MLSALYVVVVVLSAREFVAAFSNILQGCCTGNEINRLHNTFVTILQRSTTRNEPFEY